LVLQMAERRDADTVHTRGVKDACTSRHADRLAVDRDLNDPGRCGSGCHTRGGFRRAGLLLRAQQV
jgi:hypothetical protein